MNKIENIFLEFQKIQEENPDKIFEILEGEIREVLPNEGEEFWKDPINADEKLQRKYIGVAYKDFQEPQEKFEGQYNSDRYKISEVLYVNPYTREAKIIESLEEIPKPTKEEIASKIISGEEVSSEYVNFTDKEIGDIILNAKFEGNIHAQLASLLKFNAKLLGYLASKYGQEEVFTLFATELSEAREISEIRKRCGISELKI